MSGRSKDQHLEEPTDRARNGAEAPITARKDYGSPSVFRPEALLREARRQKDLPVLPVPPVCILDPDGDIVRRLRRSGDGCLHDGWACYHTELLAFALADVGEVGVVGCAVGAPFAVLVAEQLFASGCELLVSVTSAGQIVDRGPTPYFVLIDRALRDEGTSYHYLPPDAFVSAPDSGLIGRVEAASAVLPGITVYRGTSWTTDAPYRETEEAIGSARSQNVLAVEMEAAALYALATTARRSVVCFAHVTNSMAQTEGDFEKGEADGTTATLAVIAATAKAWRNAHMTDDSKFIEQSELRERMNNHERLVVVDVRSVEEFLADHIEGAINIPAHDLATRAGELPRDSAIITVCNLGGARSCGAAEQLRRLGYSDAAPLGGGIRGWKDKA